MTVIKEMKPNAVSHMLESAAYAIANIKGIDRRKDEMKKR